jgi:hypothetical protein
MSEEDPTPSEKLTSVDPSLFKSPVKRIGVSGGTAPFFRLELTQAEDGSSKSKYIGKDLSRARDEVSFYEKILAPAPNASRDALGGICDFMFPYLGILKTKEEGQEKVELDLLVLENLFDGKKQLRLLDLKMGSSTASANWQGKSRLRAFKQQLFDKTTNSVKEGYRLEGFDGCPQALKTMVPLIEHMMQDEGDSKSSKKSRRLMFQQLEGTKIFQHLLDIHLEHATDNDETMYDSVEYLEITMHEIVKRLTKLAIACHAISIPQKWIGSSLAIGFDAGEVPNRSKSEEDIRNSAIVRVFDWGRSELNDTNHIKTLTESEIKDRECFWEQYKAGIDTISWVATHKYLNRFCCASWESITFLVYDHDSVGNDDFMCSTTVLLKETEMKKQSLLTKRGRKAGTLTYSIEWKEFKENSRMKGAWKITIGSGEDLPNLDIGVINLCGVDTSQASDPYVIIRPLPSSKQESPFVYEQLTTVKENNLNPVWNEHFSIPVSHTDSDLLQEAFDDAELSPSDAVISKSKSSWVERVKATSTKAD